MQKLKILLIVLLVVSVYVDVRELCGDEKQYKEEYLQQEEYIYDTTVVNQMDKETLELLGPMSKYAISKSELQTMLSIESMCNYWDVTAVGTATDIDMIRYQKVEVLDTNYLIDLKFKTVFDFFSDSYQYIDYYGKMNTSPEKTVAVFYYLMNNKELFMLIFCSKDRSYNNDLLLFDQNKKKENLKYFLNSKKYIMHQIIIDIETLREIQNMKTIKVSYLNDLLTKIDSKLKGD